MATTITVADVRDSFDTEASDDEISLAITIISQADDCLDANSVAADVQKALKLYAVRHIITMQSNSGRGTVTSESAPSGASRSYGQWKQDGGSPYWELLKQLDRCGCVVSLLENKQRVSIWSVGGPVS